MLFNVAIVYKRVSRRLDSGEKYVMKLQRNSAGPNGGIVSPLGEEDGGGAIWEKICSCSTKNSAILLPPPPRKHSTYIIRAMETLFWCAVAENSRRNGLYDYDVTGGYAFLVFQPSKLLNSFAV